MTSANQTPNVNAPTPLDWEELIASARHSLTGQPPESRAANHRAISTAYYAAYDALCASNAAVLAPQVADPKIRQIPILTIWAIIALTTPSRWAAITNQAEKPHGAF